MRGLIVGTVAVTSFLWTASASAGGWATVSMSSHPSKAEPGKPWVVDLTVLQHGQTPLAGVRPIFTIRDVKTGAERHFPAKATDEVGVYRATVVFPRAGSWDYEIDDGFTQVQTYAPVAVGADATAARPEAPKPDAVPDVAPAADGAGSSALLALVAVAVAVALAMGAVLALRRQRQHGAGA